MAWESSGHHFLPNVLAISQCTETNKGWTLLQQGSLGPAKAVTLRTPGSLPHRAQPGGKLKGQSGPSLVPGLPSRCWDPQSTMSHLASLLLTLQGVCGHE